MTRGTFTRFAALVCVVSACRGEPAQAPKSPPQAVLPKAAAAAEAPDPEPFRQTRPQALEPANFAYPTPQRFTLKNGLSVYLVERNSRIVALTLAVRHGASSVPEGKSGLAALTARMLTESTRRKSSAALAEAVESLGTTLASSSSRDESNVSLGVLPRDLSEALALLVEVTTEPAFSERDLGRVRAEWLDGLRAERQNPQRLATLAAVRGLFGPRHGAPTFGSIPEVEKLTATDLREFHRQAYTPDNSALVVVGPVKQAELSKQLERLYLTVRGKNAVATRAAELPPAPQKMQVLLIDRPDAVQSAVIALQPFPKRSDPHHEAREVLGKILGGLFTSRLNTNLREKHAFTYGAFARPVASRVYGALVISTSVRSDVTAKALDQIVAELKRIRDPKLGAPIAEDELGRAKADLIFSLGATLEHPSRVAESTLGLFTEDLPLDYDSRYPELIRAVTRDEVVRAANAITPERLFVVVVGDRAKIEPDLARAGYAPELAPAALIE
jgi:zinc protease